MASNNMYFKGRIPVKMRSARLSAPKPTTSRAGSSYDRASKSPATVRDVPSEGSQSQAGRVREKESPPVKTPSTGVSKTPRAPIAPSSSSAASYCPISTAKNFSRLPQRPHVRKLPGSSPLAQPPQVPDPSSSPPVNKPLPSPPIANSPRTEEVTANKPLPNPPSAVTTPGTEVRSTPQAAYPDERPSLRRHAKYVTPAIKQSKAPAERTGVKDGDADDQDWPLPNAPSDTASTEGSFRVKRLSVPSAGLASGLGPILKIDKKADSVLLGEGGTSSGLPGPGMEKGRNETRAGPAAPPGEKPMPDRKPVAAFSTRMNPPTLPRVLSKPYVKPLPAAPIAGASSEAGSLYTSEKKPGIKKTLKTFFKKPPAGAPADPLPETPAQRLQRLELAQAVADCLEQVAEAKVAAARAEQMARDATLRCQRADLAMGRVVALVSNSEQKENRKRDGLKE